MNTVGMTPSADFRNTVSTPMILNRYSDDAGSSAIIRF